MWTALFLEMETLLSKREEPMREKALFTQQKLQRKVKPKEYVLLNSE